jgi:uncharacterized protein
MQKTELLTMLNTYKQKHQSEYGIKRLGLFGSCARGTSTDHSDIDIVVELEKQDLYSIIGIKQDLEEQLGSRVDIVSYRNRMNPFLKQRIDQEAVYA